MKMKVMMGLALVVALAIPATAGVIIEDWADGADQWSGTIGYTSGRVVIDTANQVLRRTHNDSNTTKSAQFRGWYDGNVPSTDHWLNLDGMGLTRMQFSYKNTGGAAQDWSSDTDSSITLSFQQVDGGVSSSTVRFNFYEFMPVVGAGETVDITVGFDTGHVYRTYGNYGWTLAEDRIRLGGWSIRYQYVSFGSVSPFEISEIEFLGPPAPPQPVAEPGALGLLGIGLLAARRKRS